MSAATAYRVLIVDDDKSVRASLVDLLESAGWQVKALTRAANALPFIDEFMPDVVLSDVRMPGMSGLELLAALRDATPVPVVLISAHGDIPMAVQAMQEGAYSFLEKPYDPRRLLTVLDHAAERHRLAADTTRLKDRLARLSGLDRLLLGETEEIKRLREDILNLTDSGAPVMLLGETGTGKDVVARALHDLGPRAAGPYLVVDCATIRAEDFETEMFGTVDGPRGKLLSADGGALYLDEICACPEQIQAKLARAIETSEITPIGADRSYPVDLHIISATNEDPHAAIEVGRLRPDLFYRLNAVMLTLPTVRQRRDDIALLYTQFVDEFSRVYEIEPPIPTQEDFVALLAHDWPGNVRELRHVAERRVLAARRGYGSAAEAIRPDTVLDDVPDTLREAVAAFERELVSKAIKAHRGRMDAVAEALGIGRRTLNEKIVKLGLDKDALL